MYLKVRSLNSPEWYWITIADSDEHRTANKQSRAETMMSVMQASPICAEVQGPFEKKES